MPGGRHYRDADAVDQNFDSYAVEYTFEDGSTFQLNGRTMIGCHDQFASYAHGSKGLGLYRLLPTLRAAVAPSTARR